MILAETILYREEPSLMPALTMRSHFLALIPFAMIVTLIAGIFELAVALDPLPRSPRVGSLRIPLLSYARVPISKLFSDPDDYHLREIRIAGTVRTIQTKVVTQDCGVPYELTIISLEDQSGQVEVLDKGACGRNRSAVRAPMLATGDRVDLLVQVVGGANTDESGVAPEVFVLWIDRAQD
jgi:hypothetical protein